MAGRYVVYKTTKDGGGPAYDGARANGHHVFCENIADRSIKVDFYQTGDFTAVIEDIKPLGKAVLQWVEVEENNG